MNVNTVFKTAQVQSVTFKMSFQLIWLILFLHTALAVDGKIIPPQIQPIIIPKDVSIGESIHLFCTFTKGSLPIQFLWKRDDKIIQNGNRIKIENSSSYSSVLVIDSVETEDNGNYSCTVVNSAGIDTSFVQLKIRRPPAWKQEPADVSSSKFHLVKVKCAVQSSPDSTIQWFKLNGNYL